MPDSAAPPHAELAFADLRRSFGRLRVLRGVSGRVAAGELLLVSGSNGCGKSTLLRCLAGLMAPQRGTIECRVDGTALDVAERRYAVGFVSPDLELYPELTTLENLDFFGRLRGTDPRRGAELLDRLGLPHDRAAAALSSGMRQRLRFAWAVLHRPPVLLLDEPLQNLDEPGRVDVLELLREHLETGLAVVASPDLLDLPHVTSHLDLDS
ncbi:MAG: ABC transporter ATP-binding protein [bacterium]|nr:ABC transporter ATP-binding protein [bacterium]